MQQVPADAFRSWHYFFEHERYEQDKRTAAVLAMQYNTAILVASALTGSKPSEDDFKAADDFLGPAKGTSSKKSNNRLTSAEAEQRARQRYQRK